MPTAADQSVLEALLDSWNRSNTILLNLLRTLPDGGFETKAMEGSPAVAVQFSHVHQTRMFRLTQTAPEFAQRLESLFFQRGEEWLPERNVDRIAQGLEASANAIGQAVKNRIESGQPMKGEHASYDHPVLLLQHMLWHEGYHVGQIKLALKAMGFVMTEEQEEKTIWSVWRTEVW